MLRLSVFCLLIKLSSIRFHLFLWCDCIQLIAQIFRTLFTKTALCLPQTELTEPIKLTWHPPANLFDSSVIPAHQGKWLMVHGIGPAQIIPVNKWFTCKHRKQGKTPTAANAFPLWVLHYMLGCWDQRPSCLGWLSSVILRHHSGRRKVPVVKHYMQHYTCNLKGLIVNQTCCWAIQCTKLTAWENHYPTTVRAELRIKKYIYNTQIWKGKKEKKKRA